MCPLHAFKVAFYAENETFIRLMEVLRLGGTCKYRNTTFFECLRLDFLCKRVCCYLEEDHNFLIKLLIYCRLIAKMVVFVWCGLWSQPRMFFIIKCLCIKNNDVCLTNRLCRRSVRHSLKIFEIFLFAVFTWMRLSPFLV